MDNITYLKNYDKKEIKFDPDGMCDYPQHWEETDRVKQLGSADYPIDKNYKRVL